MKKTKFQSPGAFTQELHKRVDSYFEESGISRNGNFKMFLKSIVIIILFISSYLGLLFSDSTPEAVLFCILLSQSFVLVGFNIMHDGNHGSFSNRKWLNKAAGFSLDIIGANSFLWKHKHNYLHHTYTNIHGKDDDLDTAGFIRLHPDEEWKPHHRFQHIYAAPLYAILTLYWYLYHDFVQFFQKRIGSFTIRRVPKSTTILFLLTKLFYISYIIIVPLFFHDWKFVLITFIAVHLMASFTISLVFQLAHTLEVNAFPNSDDSDDEWTIHQIKTTSNFSRRNSLASSYLGALNYQIEHHLFPKVCHIHYPKIAEITKKLCEEFNIEYISYPSITSAVKAHGKFLKVMGVKPAHT